MLAVFQCKPRIAACFSFEILDAEQFFCRDNIIDRTFDLHIITKRKLVQNDLDIIKMPCFAVFFVDDGEFVAELFDDIFGRLDIGNVGLEFDLMLEIAIVLDLFFIGENGLFTGFRSRSTAFRSSSTPPRWR